MASQAADLAHECSFTVGTVLVEPGPRTARGANGDRVRIEPRVMQVLIALAGADGMVLSRADLRNACWEGRQTSDDAIDRVIAQIRRLGEGPGGGSFTVETVPKVGYRLIEHGPPNSTVDRVLISRRVVIGSGIGAAAMAAGAALVAPRWWRGAPSVDGPITIAVLPFTADSSATSLADFASQLSDEVRSDLSRVTDIRVIAQTSSRSVAKEGGSPAAIGKSLRADFLVEGQVASGGEKVVATISLVDTRDGSQVWSERESGSARDPTVIRSAVSGAIIQELAGIIPISTLGRSAVKRPDPEAYALVQEANRLLEDARTTSMRGHRGDALNAGERAAVLARRALAIDPNDGGGLAVLATIARNGWTPALASQNLTTEQRVQSSVEILRRALLVDPRNPAALAQLGDYYRRFAFRWDEAENLFRRALAIDPSFVDAHWSYAYELGTLGRAIEGLDHALSVFELDPRNPFRRVALPRLLYLVGQRPAAMRRYDAELREEPDNLFLLRELYFMFLAEGNAVALQGLARRMRQVSATRRVSPEVSALIVRIEAGRLALTGKADRLRAQIDADVRDFDRPAAVANATPQGRARDDLPFIFAIEYAWAGLPDQAITMLDRALVAKSLYWPATLPFGVAPFPKSVRDDPRFAALWSRDPGLLELVKRRRAAILAGQMAGFAPNGLPVRPAVPAKLVRRVRAALVAH